MSAIDVVVVNYNGGGHLRRAIGCLQQQTFQDFRILVIDNGSTDGSLEDLPRGSIPMEVVRSPRNLGFAGGNNLALRHHVTAAHVALLNPDAFPRPDWLQQLFRAAQSNGDYTFFASRMLKAMDNSTLDGQGDAYHVSGLHWRIGHGAPVTQPVSDVEEVFAACGAAALYRTDDVLAVEGFDETYFCYSEDVDLAFRLRLRGGRCAVVYSAVVEHVGSATTGRNSDFSVYFGHRNLVWTFFKNMPTPLLILLLPVHGAMNLASLLVFFWRGQGAVMWRAKRDAFAMLPALWRIRRRVQDSRRVRTRDVWRVIHKGWRH